MYASAFVLLIGLGCSLARVKRRQANLTQSIRRLVRPSFGPCHWTWHEATVRDGNRPSNAETKRAQRKAPIWDPSLVSVVRPSDNQRHATMTECVTSARVTGVPASAHARRGSLACAARGDGRFRSLPSLEDGLRRMTTTAPREDACTLRATNRFATPCRHLAAARKKEFSFPPQMSSSRPSEGKMSYSARGDGRRQPSESLTANGHQN